MPGVRFSQEIGTSSISIRTASYPGRITTTVSLPFSLSVLFTM